MNRIQECQLHRLLRRSLLITIFVGAVLLSCYSILKPGW